MRLAAALAVLMAPPAFAEDLTVFPERIEASCRGGRAKLYDECSDQRALFARALEDANRQDKVLLVSYGAEWCIWCHVFDAYLDGQSGSFTHTYASPEDIQRDTATLYERPEGDVTEEAEALRAYAAEHFVLVHLDTRYAPGADEAVASTGQDPALIRGLPFIFAVTAEGRYAMAFDGDGIETRREGWDWFRGYDRVLMLAMLERMFEAAR